MVLTCTFGSLVYAQGEPTTSYKSLTFTSDEAEEEIYKRSPSAQAEARKRTQEPASGMIQSSDIKSGGEGFHRLVITPDSGMSGSASSADKGDAPVEERKPVREPVGSTPISPARKLKPWPDIEGLYTLSGTPDQIKVGLALFDENQGRLPPTGLIQLAYLYESIGDMKRAARYYYAAQLRARFDTRRFGEKGELMRKKVQRVAGDLTSRVGGWAAQSAVRLNDVLADVRSWDHATPYDYYPGFGVMAPSSDLPSESEWSDILESVREDFFRDAGKISRALSQMGK